MDKVEKLKRKAMKVLSRERSQKSSHRSRSKSKEVTSMMNTIRLPKNLLKLDKLLPKPQYEEDEKEGSETLSRGEPDNEYQQSEY